MLYVHRERPHLVVVLSFVMLLFVIVAGCAVFVLVT